MKVTFVRAKSSPAAHAALCFAVVVVAVHVAMRAAGLASHTSVLAGMPESPASLLLGPAYVLSYFAAMVIAPILAIASALDYFTRAVRLR